MNNIKLLRTKRGMTQQNLADLLNVTQQAVHKYENGLSEPDIQSLKAMSALFNTSIDYLVGNTENPRKNDYVTDTYLTQEELAHIQMYRRLSSYRRNLIDLLLKDCLQTPGC